MIVEIQSVRQDFGRRIKTIRKSNRLSQEELASRAKLHRNYISDVERGERNLSLEALIKLSIGLGISIRDLF
jgi:transcriptional regulator with XRE-family HTH domain